jgi:hypothetical protein
MKYDKNEIYVIFNKKNVDERIISYIVEDVFSKFCTSKVYVVATDEFLCKDYELYSGNSDLVGQIFSEYLKEIDELEMYNKDYPKKDLIKRELGLIGPNKDLGYKQKFTKKELVKIQAIINNLNYDQIYRIRTCSGYSAPKPKIKVKA